MMANVVPVKSTATLLRLFRKRRRENVSKVMDAPMVIPNQTGRKALVVSCKGPLMYSPTSVKGTGVASEIGHVSCYAGAQTSIYLTGAL
ncbi:hypothetical protein NPIL_621291 [Nephila pilipes]|uniref:Uncharacterized protein n=1 Tax=Nephila pilipes TaxID=299642 RepID=A0A8X6QK75_NEPPI|nr:hypothetical protein NPIL_621291 [Nephila pilipes]